MFLLFLLIFFSTNKQTNKTPTIYSGFHTRVKESNNSRGFQITRAACKARKPCRPRLTHFGSWSRKDATGEMFTESHVGLFSAAPHINPRGRCSHHFSTNEEVVPSPWSNALWIVGGGIIINPTFSCSLRGLCFPTRTETNLSHHWPTNQPSTNPPSHFPLQLPSLCPSS